MDDPKIAKKVDQKVEELLDKVETVIDQQKDLAQKQDVILEQVNVDEKQEKEVEKEVEKVNAIHSSFIVRTKSHKFLFPLIVTAGVVLVWRGLSGIFDATPLVNYSFVSLLLGILILWIFNNFKSL